LARILKNDSSDPYISAAAVSSLTQRNISQVLDGLVGSISEIPEPLLENLLRTALGYGEVEGLKSLFAQLIVPPKPKSSGNQSESHFAAVAVFLDAVEERKKSHRKETNEVNVGLRSVLSQLTPVFSAARTVVVDGNAPLGD